MTAEEIAAEATNIIELFKQVCRENSPYEYEKEVQDYYKHNFEPWQDMIVETCKAYASEKNSQALTAYRTDVLSIVYQGGTEEDIMKLDLGKYNL